MSGQLLHLPSAPALLLASSLYVSLEGRAEGKQSVSDALTVWQPERDIKHREVKMLDKKKYSGVYVRHVLYISLSESGAKRWQRNMSAFCKMRPDPCNTINNY